VKIGARTRKYIIAAFGVVAVLALLYVLFGQQLRSGWFTDNVENKKRMYSSQLETKLLEGPYEFYVQQYTSRLADDNAKLLPGDTRNVSESELLSALDDFAQKSGVEIIQKIPDQNQNQKKGEKKGENPLYSKVSYRIIARCSGEQLVQLLTEIRNYNRYLTIDDLQIQTRGSRNRTNTNTELSATLTVSGYIRSNEGAGGKDQDAVM
jgi:hypothetical protein